MEDLGGGLVNGGVCASKYTNGCGLVPCSDLSLLGRLRIPPGSSETCMLLRVA